jgi:DNA-binding transcriptional ArsR family regulator
MRSRRGTDLPSILLGRARASILALLLGQPEQALHMREIARRCALAVATVQQELRLLERVGLLARSKQFTQVLYRANSESPAFVPLRDLLARFVDIVGATRAALHIHLAKTRVAFIKEAASGDGAVEVIVIGDVSFEDVLTAVETASAEVHREIRPIVFTPAGFARRHKSGDPAVVRILAGSRQFIHGAESEIDSLATEK